MDIDEGMEHKFKYKCKKISVGFLKFYFNLEKLESTFRDVIKNWAYDIFLIGFFF